MPALDEIAGILGQVISIPPIIWQWYGGLIYVALLLAAIVCLWIYYDANRKGLQPGTAFAVAVVCAVAIVPSFVWSLLSALQKIMSLQTGVTLAWIGIIGAVGVIVAALMYLTGAGQQQMPPIPISPTVPIPPAQPPIEPLPTGRPRVAPVERTRLMHEQAPAAGWLVAKSGPRAGQSLPLSRGSTTIGRSTRCNQIVEDPSVSGEHCRIIFENGQFVIYDLASLNGTYVNGHKVQRQMLMDGDRIRLANSEFVFKKA